MSLDQGDVKEFNDEYDIVSQNIGEVLEYVEAGFNGRIEGAELYSLTVKCVDDGEFRFTARSKRADGSGIESGFVAYGTANSFSTCVAAFECCLRFGLIGWRKDKYFKPKAGGFSLNGVPKRVKLK